MRLRQITQIIALLAAATILSATPASAQSWPNGNQTQVSQQGQLSLTQPPIIEYADPHTVTVMWQTDQNATGVLRWGADPSNLSMGAQQDDRSRTHRIRVMNQFQPNSTYYFQVLSQSNNGQVVSPVMSFTTPSNGQVVRQQQPNIVGGPYGDQNAQGSYGQGPYSQPPYGGYGLPQSSEPVAGNAQLTYGPIVEYADAHSATIMFQTASEVNANVRFGDDPNNLTQVARVGGYGNPHRVQMLNAFQPGQTYYFQIVSRGQALTPVFSFHTPSDNKPIRQQQPQQVSAEYGNGGYSNAPYGNAYPQGGYGQYGQPNGPQDVRILQDPVIRAQGPDSAVVTWRTNAPSSAVVHYGTDPNNLSETATAPWGGTLHRVVITNLNPGTQYYVRVESAQGQGTGTGTMSNVVQFQAGTNSNWPR